MPLTLKNFNKTIPLVTTPGIYHNSNSGLISLSSDGTNWITIADKNLGATQVYNDGATMSEANCGKFYQRGNNYGFPFTGATITSSTQVNASVYGPGNYYYSSTFITNAVDWDSSINFNRRGGLTNLVTDKRGPCEEGYHIPLQQEWLNVDTILASLGVADTNKRILLMIPYSGILHQNSGSYNGPSTGWNYGRCWCSNGDTTSTANNRIYRLSVNNSTYFTAYGLDSASQGNPIRPFKDTPVQPDETWTVLYQ